MEKYIVSSFQQLGIVLIEDQVKQFIRYYELLIEKNRIMNLTAITNFKEVVIKHFLDSLLIAKIEKIEGTLIDVGTGAGFPGIPLKILYPQLQVVLLDSLNKRVQFLKEIILELGLEKIEAIHGRAEDYGKQALYREQFDFCVSRAVANLSSLSEYCLPFVKVGGLFIPYKSDKIQEELELCEKAITTLGGEIENKEKLELPGTDIFRYLLRIRKVTKTPKKYPRKAGIPTKEPIQ